MFYTIEDIKAAAAKSEFNKNTIKKLEADFEELIKTPIEELPYEKFSDFKKTGGRNSFERLYFARRKRLAKYAVLAMVKDDERYIRALEEIIWAICGEFTWSVPAHMWPAENMHEAVTNIDLFASETGQALSEIDYILAGRLSQDIRERIKYEVRRRIINPFAERACHWERIRNNWASVCAGSVAMAYMYQAERKEFDREYPRFESAMNYFLSSYGEDGACREGAGYWNYGFGYFVYYAEMLRRYTNGETDCFADAKVNSIARFQQVTYLTPDRLANFSDCGSGFGYRRGLTCFLANEYEDVRIPPEQCASGFDSDGCYRWAHLLRDFLWCDTDKPAEEERDKYYFLPDAQWYIRTKDKYAFAAKGGNNGEPHNHNDAGSYILISDGTAVSDELGMGEYTREYFGEETRYTLYPNRSMGHSVPIIDGTEQAEGEEYSSVIISRTRDEFVVDIAGAYPLPELKSLVRRFELKDDAVILTDEFEGKVNTAVERVMTREKPTVEGDGVHIGSCVIECSACPEISEAEYADHSGNMQKIYFVDYKFSGNKITLTYKCK